MVLLTDITQSQPVCLISQQTPQLPVLEVLEDAFKAPLDLTHSADIMEGLCE